MLVASILLPLLATFLIPRLKKIFTNIHLGIFVIPIPIFIFSYLLTKIKDIFNNNIVINNFKLMNNIGLDIYLILDGLSLLFALLISGIGSLVIFYSIYYMDKNDPKLHKFYTFLMLFMSAMLGVVLSNNLLSMYMFWELTSISSFLLISYWYENKSSRKGALKSLIITVFGGVMMLVGIFILQNITGSFNINEIIKYSTENSFPEYIKYAMVLIVLGAFTKSSQFPFHIWLPDAMVAPTPISSYLHSATMVKAGIYLLLRIGIIFSYSATFANTLIIFGSITLILGSITAIFLTDLKGILAYSTISQLGMMTLMIGIGNLGLISGNNYAYTFAFYTVCFHIINHAVFKASLFMVTGVIDHTFHTRNIVLIRGARLFIPAGFIISVLSGMSMAGVPPFSGFYSKEYFLEVVFSLFNQNSIYLIVILISIIASLGTFIYSMIISFKPFLGKYNINTTEKDVHIPSVGIMIAPLLLALFTIANNIFKDIIVIPAQKAVLSHNITGNIIISSSSSTNTFSKELITTLAIIFIGTIVYIFLASKNTIYNYNPIVISIHRLYENLGNKLHSLANKLHDMFITNKLRRNMSYIFVFLSLTIITTYFVLGRPNLIGNFSKLHYFNLLLAFAISLCCLALAFINNRLILIMVSSGIGFMMTALYVTFRAPDLAMTQFVIESISTIIFLIAFIVLTNKTKHIEKMKFKLTNAVISIITGLSFILVGLVSFAYKNKSLVSDFYSEQVIPSGGGNIVNVIIVDFRGFDTLFEITVMSVVALVIYSMFKILKKERELNKNEN